jgi:hypothetical protein
LHEAANSTDTNTSSTAIFVLPETVIAEISL